MTYHEKHDDVVFYGWKSVDIQYYPFVYLVLECKTEDNVLCVIFHCPYIYDKQMAELAFVELNIQVFAE